LNGDCWPPSVATRLRCSSFANITVLLYNKAGSAHIRVAATMPRVFMLRTAFEIRLRQLAVLYTLRPSSPQTRGAYVKTHHREKEPLFLHGLTPSRIFLPGKSTIERCRRADQREMRKRLRKVPEVFAARS
jgi:hypothetical protein